MRFGGWGCRSVVWRVGVWEWFGGVGLGEWVWGSRFVGVGFGEWVWGVGFGRGFGGMGL